jgi:23S rRNA pseudouridine1911/1915/1917 synthase
MESYVIVAEEEDVRLDMFLASHSSGLSRSRVQALIRKGDVLVNACSSKPSYRLKAGDKVVVIIPPPASVSLEPEDIAFPILYEDHAIVILNKPPGLVVHPAPGHGTGTLVHGLLRHCRDLSGIGGLLRPGIVHRLDKDTSGIMVVAKNDNSHAFLSEQFKMGVVQKRYLAVVHGCMKEAKGRIDLPIGRHSRQRKKMAVAGSGGRAALTEWQTLESFQNEFTLLSLSLKTGRTHQIRVHLSAIGHPVLGDMVYSYGRQWLKIHSRHGKSLLPVLKRQMLHASDLGFIHPVHRDYVRFHAPMPDDMALVLQKLKEAGEESDSTIPPQKG